MVWDLVGWWVLVRRLRGLGDGLVPGGLLWVAVERVLAGLVVDGLGVFGIGCC